MQHPSPRLLCTLLGALALSACTALTPPEIASRPERPLPSPKAQPAPPNTTDVAAVRAPPSYPGVVSPAPSTLIKAETADGSAAGASFDDLMDRIRAGFQIPEEEQRAINVQLAWYERNPEYLDRVFGRAALYMHYIVEEVERRGMPMEIALLPVIESAFEPYAYSVARASGLWQFIPDTGSRFGLPQNWWYDGRRDVMESTRAALDYLQFMHDEFEGDWLLAVAGYNCGENCVARAVARNRAQGKGITFWDLKLPKETTAYVPKLLAMKRLVANPSDLGIEFSPIPNEPYFAKVDIGQQIDLKLAAELAGLTHEELFELNPAFHRWATPPQGPHALLMPIDSAELFKENLAQLNADELMRVTHHVTEPGETLASLAARYGTNVMTLRMLNGLADGPLAAGTDLRVPSGSTQLPPKVMLAAARVDGPAPALRKKRGKPEVHVVRRGESIWTIARRNNMDPRTLMRLNGKSAKDKLRPGERLVLSGTGGGGGKAAASGSSKVTHRVRSGETLYSIARRYGVTIAQIVSWNGLSANRTLRIGQRLTIRTKRS
jgi:membrane-bound lytic murein transglycosylase D